MILNFKKSLYAGIFLVAASTLLLEITLTKIFSVIHFHYSAFLIISTALFGYGFSGVYMSLGKRFRNPPSKDAFSIYSLAFGVTTVIAYRLILLVPLRINELASHLSQAL